MKMEKDCNLSPKEPLLSGEEAFYYSDRYGYIPDFISEEEASFFEVDALENSFFDGSISAEDGTEDHLLTPEEVLKKYWGFDEFRPKQRDIIDSVLSGKDTLGLLPTGGGKSISFQVPGLLLKGITLVITPLIALMKDQVAHLRKRNIKAVALHSGLYGYEMQRLLDNAVHGAYKFLYLSPERLSSSSFVAAISHLKVSLIVVDECHCISQWGYDFRPSYLRISELRKYYPEVPVLALTATATPEVTQDVMKLLGFSLPNVISRSFLRPNLAYVVRRTEDKPGMMLQILRSVPGSAIIYCRNRERTQQLTQVLREAGITADFFHAGLTHAERDEHQKRWMEGSVRVMVATNAFGMGIDKPNVRVVIHWLMPSSLEEYFQEAGRAGRDEQKAYAVVLVSRYDKAIIARRLQDEFPQKNFIRSLYDLVTSKLGIGLGDGLDRSFTFNVEHFVQEFRLPPIQTMSAVRLLDMMGVWEYQESEEQRSRVTFLVTRDELYNNSLVTPAVDNLVRLLLRTYPGLFSDYVFIDEKLLSRELSMTLQDVYLSLSSLSHRGVIHYIPKTSEPRLVFRSRREEGRHLPIPYSIYEERKQRLSERLECTIAYISSEERCRSALLLDYFGETLVEGCGCCDVCLQKKKNRKPSEEPFVYLLGFLKEQLKEPGQSITVERILQVTKMKREELGPLLSRIVETHPHFFFDGFSISYR